MDGAQVRVFDSRSGRQVDSIGRFGLGPGEFGRVPQLLGTYSRPLAFEGGNGRISVLGEGARPVTSRVATGRNWITGCLIAPGRVLLQAVGWNDDGYWVSTIGDDAALIDSFAHPIVELRTVLPLGRQASAQQADDSTCVLLPIYARRFAVLRSGEPPQFGDGVEDAPLPEVDAPPPGVRGTISMAVGTRSTHRSASTWRGGLLVLYGGATDYRRRLVDLYDRQLTYRSSVVLPFEARHIAVSGDTLFALGEQEDEPILAAFLLWMR
jgi:hypothetical protein